MPLTLGFPFDMGTSWSDVEDAIRQWVIAGSGLSASKVIFADQNGRAPSGTVITIKLGDPIPVGQDCIESLTDLDRDAGEEIEHRTMGVREFAVTLQAFTADTSGSGTARAWLSKIQAALRLPSISATLHGVGISAFDIGRIQVVNQVVEADFEGRAILEVRFYANESVSEFDGYISQVNVSDLDLDIDFTVTS